MGRCTCTRKAECLVRHWSLGVEQVVNLGGSTKRFMLRTVKRSDAPALYPTFSDEAQCRYMSQPHVTSAEALADWLAATTRGSFVPYGNWRFDHGIRD